MANQIAEVITGNGVPDFDYSVDVISCGSYKTTIGTESDGGYPTNMVI
jgi:hypothetical protein